MGSPVYEILAPIGKGGMGEVWKARDPRLNRIGALKRLKGQHTARFEQEAHAIVALNHPNICQIHDIGPDYLVMEYVEGKPLSGPLRVEEALKLAVQIASAIEEAHGKGILHGDGHPALVYMKEVPLHKWFVLPNHALAQRSARLASNTSVGPD